MQGIAKHNSGMRYLFTVIDVYFKFAWVVPVQSKDAKTITKTFDHLLTVRQQRHPQRLQTDKSKSVFFNSDFQTLIKRHKIQHFASESNQMAAVVVVKSHHQNHDINIFV